MLRPPPSSPLFPYTTLFRSHLGPDTVLEYRYASSQPSTRAAKGFDTAPADLTESGPRKSLDGDQPVLERARHHERSEEHTSELQSHVNLVCRLLLEKKKQKT